MKKSTESNIAAFTSWTVVLTTPRFVTCVFCDGRRRRATDMQCAHCNGKGYVEISEQSG